MFRKSRKTLVGPKKNEQINPQFLIQEIIERLPGHVYWKNKHGEFLGCNTEQAISLGYKAAYEVLGKNDHDLKPIEEADAIVNLDRKIMGEKKSVIAEEFSISKSGKRQIYLSNKVPLFNSNGSVIGLLGISFDITSWYFF
jgi:two-component system aerobic respiration control sensor histidine kinase ArcB